MQGIAVNYGLEERIKWESVFRASAAAAVASGFSGYNAGAALEAGTSLGIGLQQDTLAQYLLRAVVSNITQQFVEMQIKPQVQFNVGSIFLSLHSAGAGLFIRSAINDLPYVPGFALDDITSVATGFMGSSLSGHHLYIDALAAGLIGAHVGNYIGQKAATALQSTHLYQEIERSNVHQHINAGAPQPRSHSIEERARELNAGSINRTKQLKAQAAAKKAAQEAASKAEWEAWVHENFMGWDEAYVREYGWDQPAPITVEIANEPADRASTRTTQSNSLTISPRFDNDPSLFEFDPSFSRLVSYDKGFLKSQANGLLEFGELYVNFSPKTLLAIYALELAGLNIRIPTPGIKLPRFTLYPDEAGGVLASEVFDVASLAMGIGSAAKVGIKLVKNLNFLGIFSQTKSELFTAKSLIINARNQSKPYELEQGYGTLSARQQELLEMLPESGNYIQVYKSDVSVTDLSALTAQSGNEFIMFTLGSQRILLRGNAAGFTIDGMLFDKITMQNWRLSAHTHPGIKDNVLMSSGSDRQTLEILNQNRSLILNSAGRRSVFDNEVDYFVTKNSSYSSQQRNGY